MAQNDTVLIRYGELTTKGKNRKQFTNRLLNNIKLACSSFSKLEYRVTYDRLYIQLNGENVEDVCAVLSKVFGISSFSITKKVESSLEAIVATSYQMSLEFPTGTFKMQARRSNKQFPSTSDDINRACASYILKNTEHKVDVHHPDFKIIVEVHKDYTYITSKIYPGLGGYPVGINGKAMLLLSGGIDSPVAGYMMMKRGVQVEAIHFASPPYTSANALNKVVELARLISGFQGQMKLHVVPFTDLQLKIYENCPESYAITIIRRMMMRITERFAQQRNCLCIASGESLGQVASQTLESMSVINEVIKMPLLRPVVTFDKNEIIDVAKQIGTYETSILPFEDCCTIFNPKNPTTKPHLHKVLAMESKFDYETAIEQCLSAIETIVVHPVKEEESYL